MRWQGIEQHGRRNINAPRRGPQDLGQARLQRPEIDSVGGVDEMLQGQPIGVRTEPITVGTRPGSAGPGFGPHRCSAQPPGEVPPAIARGLGKRHRYLPGRPRCRR